MRPPAPLSGGSGGAAGGGEEGEGAWSSFAANSAPPGRPRNRLLPAPVPAPTSTAAATKEEGCANAEEAVAEVDGDGGDDGEAAKKAAPRPACGRRTRPLGTTTGTAANATSTR
mmetsp:Transcript_113714/g.285782  ORF Transcript_113714/g.285782 Transcript_113714/m.285782 type:complete len:114 (+) Transcript_113714:106-447(+)